MALQARRLSGKVIGIPLPELYPYLTTKKLTDQMQEVLNGGNALLLSPVFYRYFIPIPTRVPNYEHVVQYTRLLPIKRDGNTIGLLILIEDYTERMDYENTRN